jgi:3-hydroxyisobutyrate dehydrogenase-like beta-hydroxyacid dehydrogenase
VKDATRTVGFIGLGLMGRLMAANLKKRVFASSPST